MQLSEIYTSIQGEGPNVGRPTTFVRFGGCNLRCPGWGVGKLPDGTEVRGCDTVYAVYPEWRKSWHSLTPEEILSQLDPEVPAVCLTGGEPLIQRSKDINELAFAILYGGWDIDLFTNGTQYLGSYDWTSLDKVTVVMDWKLPGSGEHGTFDLNNLAQLRMKDAIKFVCKDREDYEVALSHLEWAETRGLLNCQVYFGVVWDELTEEELAEWILDDYPRAKLNIQTHKMIWSPDERGI